MFSSASLILKEVENLMEDCDCMTVKVIGYQLTGSPYSYNNGDGGPGDPPSKSNVQKHGLLLAPFFDLYDYFNASDPVLRRVAGESASLGFFNLIPGSYAAQHIHEITEGKAGFYTGAGILLDMFAFEGVGSSFSAGLSNIPKLGFSSSAADISRSAFSRVPNFAVKMEPAYINLASSSRTAHIIAGDATGGGHAWFGSLNSFANGLTRSKTMFPSTWSNSKIMHAVSDVAVNNPWIQQTGKAGEMFTKSGKPVRFVVEGIYQGTKIKVITTHTDIITAFPIK